MNTPELVQIFEDLTSEELRQAIALAAGIHASRDGDNGEAMAEALARIACRLRLQPWRAA